MAKTSIEIDKELKKQCTLFLKNTDSNMHYLADLDNTLGSTEWLEIMEETFPYIDKIVRVPKVALITETETQQIEKAKKIGVESVKDLAKHSNYIEKVISDKEIKPSKILVLLREETYNTYENRFIYTLVHETLRFIILMEEKLKKLESKDQKQLEYTSTTSNGKDRVKISLRISASEIDNGAKSGDFDSQVKDIKRRLKILKEYITLWQRCEMIVSLKKIHASFVTSPIKKTNLILKNPNFREATKLWNFLMNYLDDELSKNKLYDTNGNMYLRDILDDAFLMNYYVLDSISNTRKSQRDKLTQYAVLMITEQVKRSMEILLNNGIKVSEEKLLQMVNIEINNDKNRNILGSSDIKKKFKKEMDEYLAKAQDL